METSGHPFSYEWLTYIGGSTKTDSHTYIGKYGEGFKMSVLSIVQLGNMDISMHSQDWEIKPSVYSKNLDGNSVDMLGYELKIVKNDELTTLKLTGINISEKNTLQEGLLDFFYPGNPLFGEKIASGKDYEIYHRSKVPIPCHQKDNQIIGILYVNQLARGRLNIPIVVNYKGDIYNDKIVSQVIINIVPILTPSDIPDLAISDAIEETIDPLQFSERVYGSRKQRMERKYKISRLVMSEEDFIKENYYKTFIKIADSILHIFGTSRSDKMNMSLTYLGSWILQSSKVIEEAHDRWNQTF